MRAWEHFSFASFHLHFLFASCSQAPLSQACNDPPFPFLIADGNIHKQTVANRFPGEKVFLPKNNQILSLNLCNSWTFHPQQQLFWPKTPVKKSVAGVIKYFRNHQFNYFLWNRRNGQQLFNNFTKGEYIVFFLFIS